MKFRIGQTVKIIGPAKDKDTTCVGQIGVILHSVADGAEYVVVMFGKSSQTFGLDSVKAV